MVVHLFLEMLVTDHKQWDQKSRGGKGWPDLMNIVHIRMPDTEYQLRRSAWFVA